jgi:hypothetical protein
VSYVSAEQGRNVLRNLLHLPNRFRLNTGAKERRRLIEYLTNPENMRHLIQGMSLLAWGGGVLSWLSLVVHAIRVPFNAKPGSLRGWLKFNPLNVIFFGEKLTPKGLAMRKRAVISLIVFLACVGNVAAGAYIIDRMSQT